MSFREANLPAFSLLLSHATAAAKLAQAPAPQSSTPEWSLAAAEISRDLLASNGKKIIVVADDSMLSAYGGRADRGPKAKESYASHPLMAPGKHLTALATAVENLGAQAHEWASAEIAKHLAVAFDRDGASFLAFPQQGAGLKVRKTKSSVEVFDWTSDWAEKMRRSLPPNSTFANVSHRYRRPIEGTPSELAAAGELAQYWSAEDANRSAWARHGDFPLLGVHLDGKLSGSASSESPLNRLSVLSVPIREKIKTEYATNVGAMVSGDNVVDPALRRLGWLAIALALGDKLSPEQAASGHSAPAVRAEASACLEGGKPSGVYVDYYRGSGHEARPTLVFNGASRSARPAISAMQCAVTLATWGQQIAAMATGSNAEHKMTGSLLMKYFPYSAAADDSKGSALLADTMEAINLVKKLDAAASQIMKRAYAIAKDFESRWHEQNGISTAIADALALAPNSPVSAKALNWALANPGAGDAARRAQSNPQLGFATSTARYAGVRSTSDEETIERSRMAWSAKGLGQAGFDGLSSNPACAQFLAERIRAEIADAKRGPERNHFRQLTELAAQLFQAAFAENSTAQEALDFASWGVAQKACFVIHPDQADRGAERSDPVSPLMPTYEISSQAQAEDFYEQARGRAIAYPAALASIFRAFSHGEGMPSSVVAKGPDAIRAQAYAWVRKAASGSSEAPSIDWTADLSSSWLIDFARRSQGPMAAAMRQASADGVHGAFSARIAVALGIKAASDGNDLIAQVRESLKKSHGLGSSGWKALRSADPGMIEDLASSFEKNEPTMLRAKAQFITLKRESNQASKGAAALPMALLTWSAQFGIPLDAASAISKLAARLLAAGRSQLLLDGIRPIKANSEQEALFAMRETKAKAERLPRIMKSLADQFSKDVRDALKAANSAPAEAQKAASDKMAAAVNAIDDWLANTEDGLWQTLPPKTDFAELMRRQHDWHQEVIAKTAAGESSTKRKGKAPGWPSPMDRHADGDWSATLLESAADLIAEGKAMHHCVSSYAGKCRSGASRIFSVKLNGERASTLEMRLANASESFVNYSAQHPVNTDVWKLSQNLGRCNATINDPSALAFCAELVAKMNEAHLAWISALAAKRSAAAAAGAAAAKKIKMAT